MPQEVPSDVTTREFIERVASGDREAWSRMYEEYKRLIMGVCIAFLKDQEEALDTAHETFMKVFEKSSSINPNGNLKSWLTTIAANLCKDKLRRRKRGAQAVQQWVKEKNDDLESGSSSVEMAVEQESRNQVLLEAISQLDEEFRMPLMLKYYSKMSYQEIAAFLSEKEGKAVAEDTVGSRLNRAKGKLKKLLTESGVYPNE